MPNYIKAPRKGCFYIIQVQSALEEREEHRPLERAVAELYKSRPKGWLLSRL